MESNWGFIQSAVYNRVSMQILQGKKIDVILKRNKALHFTT